MTNVQWCAQWLRDNYQDHPNIDSLCHAMLAAAPQQQVEPVATVTVRMKADGSTHKVVTMHVGVDLPPGAKLYTYTVPRITSAQVDELKRLAEEMLLSHAAYITGGPSMEFMKQRCSNMRAVLHAALDALNGRDMTNREQAWEKHLNEQKWVFGMPGLKARPAFEAGWQARDAEIERLVEALRESRRGHYYCEDSWYSCPKAEGGCADESRGLDCDCGADEWNAKIDALLREYTPKETP